MSAPAPLASETRPALTEILGGMSKISGHRQALIRLNWLLEDETKGAQELVEVLRTDQGLSVRVIAASNTVLFRGGTPVASVQEAVVRVGAWEIRKMLLGSIMRELTQGALRSYGLAAGELWNRSLLCAVGMDVLADLAHRSSDVCYTVGLLHTVGLVVADRWLNRLGSPRVVRVGPIDAPDRSARERAALGWTSEELGAGLLESWKFSESVIAAVRHQNAPAEAGRFHGLAALLRLAQWQAHALEAERALRPGGPAPGESACHLAGVRESDVVDSLPTVKARYTELRTALGAL